MIDNPTCSWVLTRWSPADCRCPACRPWAFPPRCPWQRPGAAAESPPTASVWSGQGQGCGQSQTGTKCSHSSRLELRFDCTYYFQDLFQTLNPVDLGLAISLILCVIIILDIFSLNVIARAFYNTLYFLTNVCSINGTQPKHHNFCKLSIFHVTVTVNKTFILLYYLNNAFDRYQTYSSYSSLSFFLVGLKETLLRFLLTAQQSLQWKKTTFNLRIFCQYVQRHCSCLWIKVTSFFFKFVF